MNRDALIAEILRLLKKADIRKLRMIYLFLVHLL